MRLAIPVIAAICLAAVLSCGGEEESGPSLQVVLEANLSQLPEGTDPEETMNRVAEILKQRARAFGAEADVEVESTNRLDVRLQGADPEEAQELLLPTARLEFRRPVLDEAGDVVCAAEDADTYARPFQPDSFQADRASNVMACPADEEGTVGSVQWTPATATDTEGAERALTGSFLTPDTVVTGPPVLVAIQFNQEGSLLFEQITDELVGLPLAIFLDEELIAAPVVTQPISGGKSLIRGLELEEAHRLAALLDGGALPVPLRMVSVEETP